LEPAVKRIEDNLKEKPEQMVVDAAYPTHDAILAMAQKGIDLIGPLTDRKQTSVDSLKRRGISPEFYPQAFTYNQSTDSYRCPAHKTLHFETEGNKRVDQTALRARACSVENVGLSPVLSGSRSRSVCVSKSEAVRPEAKMKTAGGGRSTTSAPGRRTPKAGSRTSSGCVSLACAVWPRSG
jgi:hypothetical protein